MEATTQQATIDQGCNSSMDDWQLLSAYVQGDERAFEALVEKYFQMVYALASRKTRDPQLAEEIAQSVFLILSRKARGFSSRVSVCGWLMQTARFVCRDAIKMRWRRHENERKFEASLEKSPETKSEPNALGSLLDEALLTLQPEEQAAVLARFAEGKSLREIGQMLAISEDAAEKRISRSLAKLRSFMVKRGVKVSVSTVSGWLAAPSPHQATTQAVHSAVHGAHAAAQGKVAAAKTIALADHTVRLLPWRLAAKLALNLALPALLITTGVWAAREWTRPPTATFRVSDPRIATLGKAWARMDARVAAARQKYFQTAPTDPRYAAVMKEVNDISAESERIKAQFDPLWVPTLDRTRVAEFLTVELGESLNLDSSQKLAVFAYVQNRTAQGGTPTDALKAMSQSTGAEAVEIKAMLTPKQQRLFDQTYGADGLGLFAYAKVASFGK